MLTKGTVGNLDSRYRTVLKKCHLMNTFGSLAAAAMPIAKTCSADLVTDMGSIANTDVTLSQNTAITADKTVEGNSRCRHIAESGNTTVTRKDGAMLTVNADSTNDHAHTDTAPTGMR